MEKRQRARLASVGVLALVFATGAVVGVALDRASGSAAVQAQPAPREAPADVASTQPEPERPRAPRMYEQVGLGQDLLLIADSLVREYRAAYGDLYDAFRHDADSIVAASGREERFQREWDTLLFDLRDRIRALMTSEQVAKYNALLEENARRHPEPEERPDNREN